EIAVDRTEAVADPGADARPGERDRPGVHHQRRFVVVRVIRLEGADNAQIIDALGALREQLADLDAALAARFEVPLRLFEIAIKLARLALPLVQRNGLAVVGEEF